MILPPGLDPRANSGRVLVIGSVHRTVKMPVDYSRVEALLSETNMSAQKYLWNYEMPVFKVVDGKVVSETNIGRCRADSFAIAHLTFLLSEKLPDFVFTITDCGLECMLGLASYYQKGPWSNILGWKAYIQNGLLFAFPNVKQFEMDPGAMIKAQKIKERLFNAFTIQNTYVADISMPEKMFAFLQKNPQFLGVAVRSSLSRKIKVNNAKINDMVKGNYGKVIHSHIKLKKTQYLMLLRYEQYLLRIGTALYLGLQRYLKRKGIKDYDNFEYDKFFSEHSNTTPNGWVFQFLDKKEHADMFFPSHDEDEDFYDKSDINALYYSRCSFEDSREERKYNRTHMHPSTKLLPYKWSDDDFKGSQDTEEEPDNCKYEEVVILTNLNPAGPEGDSSDYALASDSAIFDHDSWEDEDEDDDDEEGPDLIGEEDFDLEDDFYHDSEDEDAYNSEVEDDDEDYDSEQEVLETIKADPDLLMKILALHSERGESMAEISQLIGAVKDLKAPEQREKTTQKQKGLSDIKPERFDESDSWEEDGDDLYNETMAQVRARLGNLPLEESE